MSAGFDGYQFINYPDPGAVSDLSPDFVTAATLPNPASDLADMGFGLTEDAASRAANYANYQRMRYAIWAEENSWKNAFIVNGAKSAALAYLGLNNPNPPEIPQDKADLDNQLVENALEAAKEAPEKANELLEAMEPESSDSEGSNNLPQYSGGGQNLVQNATSLGSVNSCP